MNTKSGDSLLFDDYRNGEKWLILLPLMHKEDVESVNLCIHEFKRLADDCNRMGYDGFVIAAELAMKYCEAHLEPLKIF